MRDLLNFIEESNIIEEITRDPTHVEVMAHVTFLESQATIKDLKEFVSAVAPTHVIRDQIGLNVTVGDHLAPFGGPNIVPALETILSFRELVTPFMVHRRYLNLHPFSDGNGRSSRVLWLWMMHRIGEEDMVARYGFLHTFYYQTLENYDMVGEHDG